MNRRQLLASVFSLPISACVGVIYYGGPRGGGMGENPYLSNEYKAKLGDAALQMKYRREPWRQWQSHDLLLNE